MSESEHTRSITIDDAIARLYGTQIIQFSDLKILPLTTLYDFAKAAAADIDEGVGSRAMLETIFDELQDRMRP
jgi:hypothetical protein